MTHSRRDFCVTAAAASLGALVRIDARAQDTGRRVFRHGVASGDPVSDGAIIWTRVTAPAGSAQEVQWEVASDRTFRRIAARGMTATGPARDHTVKIDVSGLLPATTYYYRFRALGEQSPIGRTRTLPPSGAAQIRLAVASCSNLPFGYFNAYRRIAERADLDAVLHLGDYIYEYPNGRYGDGTAMGRVPQPDREIIALEDYRMRHAQYKSDPDLQEAHRQHPWVVVWDDHEVTNNTWRDGAENHNDGEGAWSARRAAAVRAYLEWMPIREDRATRQPRIYRSFAFGDLADLVMLDTRVIDRDEQAAKRDEVAIVDNPARTLLGPAQEGWLAGELRESARAGVRWQVLGQQVMLAHMSEPTGPAGNIDTWDGYRPARERLFDTLAAQKLQNVIVLTGDVHSSWGYDLPRDPWKSYDPASGRGSAGVEIVAPAITSPSGFTPEAAAERVGLVTRTRPHLRYVELQSRGYVIVDITRQRMQADWYFVPTVVERSSAEQFGKGMVAEAGNPHLVAAGSPARPRTSQADPA